MNVRNLQTAKVLNQSERNLSLEIAVIDRDLRRAAMFAVGYTTQEVADAEGVIKNTIVSWRKHRGIKRKED